MLSFIDLALLKAPLQHLKPDSGLDTRVNLKSGANCVSKTVLSKLGTLHALQWVKALRFQQNFVSGGPGGYSGGLRIFPS